MIRKAGGRATVIALEDAFSGEDRAGLGATPLLTAPVIGPKWFGFAPQLRHLLSRADPDVVHLTTSGCILRAPLRIGRG
jgi:hypothetical protein